MDAVGAATKAGWRDALLRSRLLVPREQRDREAAALADHVVGFVAAGETVCAYVPVGSEPGSVALLDRLHTLGVRVLLPVTQVDFAGEALPLLWGAYVPDRLVEARHGLREPQGPWFDAAEVAVASTILVPALAVDRAGVRLGRGAGYYDRSLPLADPAARLVAVVRDDELVESLPAEDHDVRMTHALTPGLGVVALRE